MDNSTKIQIIKDAYATALTSGMVKSKKEFAEFLGVDRSGLSAAMNGNERYLTDSLVSKVISAMSQPSVSVSHSPHTNIATGHSQITVEPTERKVDETGGVDMIPVIPQNLYKEGDINILEYVTDEDADVQMSPAVQQFPTTTCYYQVVTSAMFPHFHQGDILALKSISQDAPIVNGEVYAIDTASLGILVRFAYDRGDKLELRSTPESQVRFEPFFIKKSDIYTIFRVVGLIRTNI